MPELPQMQALAERLEAAVGGRALEGYEPLGFTALKTVAPPPDALVGHTLEHVRRRGKYLVMEWDHGLRVLVHLSQAGRVDVESPPKKTKPKGSVVRLRFDGQTAVLVREHGTERKAAWWVLEPGDDGPLDKLGPEPDSREFEALVLRGGDKRRIHTWLRDQRTVAGIGRGYADDTLWRACLSPYATLASLDDDEVDRLHDALAVLDRAIDHYEDVVGDKVPDKMPMPLQVHRREGEPCPRCGDTIAAIHYSERITCYCPNEQTGGKVLADRRLSRLLK